MAYQAVLLDVDGTLVASNDAHARAWLEVLRDRGYEASYDDVRRRIGMGGDRLVEELTGLATDDAQNQSLRDRRDEVFRSRYLREVGALPGAARLVDRLEASGYRVVVATAASEDNVRPLLARASLERLVEQATSSDDAEESKPSPDIVEAAVERARVEPREAVLIGDTPYDRDAARRAGVAFVGVRSGGWDDEAFEGALAVYDDVAALLDAWDDSPLAR